MNGREDNLERGRKERHCELLRAGHFRKEIGLAVKRRPNGLFADGSGHDPVKVSPQGVITCSLKVCQSPLAGLRAALTELNMRCIAAEIAEKKGGLAGNIRCVIDPRALYSRREQRGISFENGTIGEQHPTSSRQDRG